MAEEHIPVPDDAASISNDSDASSLSDASTASSSSTSDLRLNLKRRSMFHTLFRMLVKDIDMQDFYINQALTYCRVGACSSMFKPTESARKSCLRNFLGSGNNIDLMTCGLNPAADNMLNGLISNFEFPAPKMNEEVLSLPLLEMFNATRLLSENKSNTISNTLRYDHKYTFSVESLDWGKCGKVNKITSQPGADKTEMEEFPVDELKKLLVEKNICMGTNYSRIVLGGILIKPYVANNLTPNILKLSFSLPRSSVSIDMTFDKTNTGLTTPCEFGLTVITGGNIQRYKWTCEIENLQFYYAKGHQAGGKKKKYRKYKTRRAVSALGKYRSRRNRNRRSLCLKNKYKNKTKTKSIKKNKKSL